MFISFLIGYVVLGLTLSAPIGPVNAAQLDKGVRGGFMPAWFIGLGAAAAAIIYIDRLSRGHSSAGASICAGVFMDVRQFCIAVYRGRRNSQIRITGLRANTRRLFGTVQIFPAGVPDVAV